MHGYSILNSKVLESAPYMCEEVSQLGGAHHSVYITEEDTPKGVSTL